MDTFKVENWEKHKLDLRYVTLDTLKCQECIVEIAKEYDIPLGYLDNSSLFVNMFTVLKKQLVVSDINEREGLKKLISLLNEDDQLRIITDMYIIWHYNQIDKIELPTLENYWDYIWYGPSDEMCLLYFPELKFLVLITDYGVVYVK